MFQILRDEGNEVVIRFLVDSLREAAHLRKIMYNDVETLAFASFGPQINQTTYDDFLVARRISELVVESDIIYDGKDGVDCLDMDGCSFLFVLDEMCVEPCRERYILAGDLIPTQPGVRVANPELQLFRILTKQHIKMNVVATRDSGKTHARWNPVTKVGFKPKGKDIATGKRIVEMTVATNGSLSAQRVAELAFKRMNRA